MAIVVLLIETMAVGATAWGWWVEMKMKKGALGEAKSEVELV